MAHWSRCAAGKGNRGSDAATERASAARHQASPIPELSRTRRFGGEVETLAQFSVSLRTIRLEVSNDAESNAAGLVLHSRIHFGFGRGIPHSIAWIVAGRQQR